MGDPEMDGLGGKGYRVAAAPAIGLLIPVGVLWRLGRWYFADDPHLGNLYFALSLGVAILGGAACLSWCAIVAYREMNSVRRLLDRAERRENDGRPR